MYFFSVHFNFTSTKSNISCNISLSKTFIVTSREAIYFKFNFSLKSGVIRNHCQITFGLYTEYSECTNDFDTELKSTFISSFAESSLQRACVFQKLCCESVVVNLFKMTYVLQGDGIRKLIVFDFTQAVL